MKLKQRWAEEYAARVAGDIPLGTFYTKLSREGTAALARACYLAGFERARAEDNKFWYWAFIHLNFTEEERSKIHRAFQYRNLIGEEVYPQLIIKRETKE
jgi:hypothetical protein